MNNMISFKILLMIILSIVTVLSIILYLTNFAHHQEEQHMDEISKLKKFQSRTDEIP